jgi:hypothetical protein
MTTLANIWSAGDEVRTGKLAEKFQRGPLSEKDCSTFGRKGRDSGPNRRSRGETP